MEWIRVDTALPGHPKVGKLARKLGLKRDGALAVLLRLWCWAAQHREDGDLSNVDPEEIAEAVGIDSGGSKRLVDTLVDTEWLDRDAEGGALRIHEWLDRQGSMIRARNHMREFRAAQKANRELTVRSQYSNGISDLTRQTKKKQQKQISSVVVGGPGGEDFVLVFPCAGKTPTFGVSSEQIATWKPLFPAVDVERDLRLMLTKITAGAVTKKTARGMPRAILAWLGRTQNSGGNGRHRPETKRSKAEIEAEMSALKEKFAYDTGSAAYQKRMDQLRVEHAAAAEL